MVIHQMQASYLIAHDRLLVRLNAQTGEELRLWLTRRMVKNLFSHIVKASGAQASPLRPPRIHATDGNERATTRVKEQAATRRADFQTPLKEQRVAPPIVDEPLLATTVHITPLEGGGLRVGFEEKNDVSKGSRNFEVTLGPPLLQGFMQMLELALQQADWGLSLSQDHLDRSASLLDAFARAEPPRYLH